MKFDLLTQLAFEADAVAVADDEHPQHQLGIDRRTADLAIEGLQRRAKLDQHTRHDGINAAQKVALRNALFEIKQVEQLALIPRLPPHHYPTPSPNPKQRNHSSSRITSPFSTASTQGGRQPAVLFDHLVGA